MNQYYVTLTKDGLSFSRWIEAENEETAVKQLLEDFPEWQAADVQTA